jgi:cytochrome c
MKMLAKIVVLFILAASSSFAAKFDIEESLRYFTPQSSDEFKQNLKHADAEKGRQYFERKCAQCHDGQKEGGHSKGPHLWNWYGRKAGSISGFEFSEGMLGSGHSWDFATLNYYLTRTDRAVPGVAMNFRGIRQDDKRAQLLAYLRTLNDELPPWP